MSYRNNRYQLRLATPEDSEAIGRVLESGSFPGKISVQFTRQPDPYHSYCNDGNNVVMPVAVDNTTREIVGVGGCVLRRAYINGKEKNTGYLTAMKTLESNRKGAVPIREAYALIRSQTDYDCCAYITTILNDNADAIRLLEKPRKNMPRYRYIGQYTVFCFGTGRSAKLPNGLLFRQRTHGVAEFYKACAPKFQFAPVDHRLHGLTDDDYYALQTDDGTMLAMGSIWNQQSYKQYRITCYSPLLRTIQKLPTQLLGYPRIPRENQQANYGCIALPMIRPDAVQYGKVLLKAICAAAGSYDFLMLGLMDDHPLYPAAKDLPHLKYKSRVYIVEFDGTTELDERPFHLEVGLL